MLAKLSLCRTHTLGGREFRCADCEATTSLYNSCGDRHCSQCSGGKRADFNDKASKLVLPGITYYQVVFTLPSELSELALANRHEMADLLFDSAWKSLSENLKQEQDYDPAAIAVLHTWNQKLEAHWHVHLLVPGEGPGISQNCWRQAAAPPGTTNSDGYYLVDADRLRHKYQQRSIKRLRRLRATGKLKLGGKFEYLRSDENWEAFLKNLASKSWVAYIQPPPAATSQGNEVVNYLTRYLTGGPISNGRILSADAREVTFMAREGKRVGGQRQQVPITLKTADFIQRWCLHVQPDQLTKTRYLGGWSNSLRAAYQANCLNLLESIGQHPSPAPSVDLPAVPEEFTDIVCEHCGSERLELYRGMPKPTWKELFWRESETCPDWYAELQKADHCRFWAAAYGSEFYDWYLETQVEGAKETEPQPAQPVQLDLFAEAVPSSGERPFLNRYLIDSF